jgi:methionyl-tRNA formyltransferase
LPLDRGGSPIQNKILTGQYKTHVSAFKITGEIDAGPIYLKKEIDLSEGNIKAILQKLSIICSEMILQIVIHDPTPEEQKGQAEIKSRRKASDSLIPNDLNSLRSIYDFIRMLDGLEYPNAHIFVGDYIFEFTSAELINDSLMTNCVIRKK